MIKFNPWRLLERFEAKHGDFYEILSQYPSTDEHENHRLRRLLQEHRNLTSMCLGYNEGRDSMAGQVSKPVGA